MATGNSSIDSCGAFPELIIDQEDGSGSWKKISQQSVLAAKLRMLQVDTRFTAYSRTKSVALLKAVGQQGLDLLQSVGFNIIHCINEEALDFINDNYGGKENTFCKYT